MELSRLVLKGAYKVLHDSPARHDDYHSITGASTYPLQFCDTLWVEDMKVAEKLIELWPNMINFTTSGTV